MADDPEDFGPLTPAQMKTLGEHSLWGESIYEVEQHLKWLQNVLNNTPPDDPVYGRFNAQKNDAESYLTLLRRFETYGAGPVIDLTHTHH